MMIGEKEDDRCVACRSEMERIRLSDAGDGDDRVIGCWG